MTKPDKHNIQSDEDLFDYKPIGKRLVEVINEYDGKYSLVVGLYGKWGQGKTTTIDYLKDELSQHNEEPIVLEFNPWILPDTKSLIFSFYDSIYKKYYEVEKGRSSNYCIKIRSFFRNWFVKNDHTILTYREQLGQYMKTIWGDFEAGGSKVIGSIGNLLSNYDIEMLKKRTGNLIEHHQKKLVIIIDDIDRLNSNEVKAIFRLVKLNADFKNAIYLMAFDSEEVSKALKTEYGDASTSGKDFIKKIITLPTILPMPHHRDLNDFLNKLLLEVIKRNEVNFISNKKGVYNTSTDESRLYHVCDLLARYILITPREIKRFVNSISFVLPLLKNEVDIIDLIGIEATKFAFPDCYLFMKNNPEAFVSISSGVTYLNENLEDIELQKHEHDHEEKYGPNEKLFLSEIISFLFPEESKDNELFQTFESNKIRNKKYFDRYFSLVVSKREFSRIMLLDFMSQKPNHSEDLMEFRNAINDDNQVAFFQMFLEYLDKIAIDNPLAYLEFIFSLDSKLIIGNRFFTSIVYGLCKQAPKDLFSHIVNNDDMPYLGLDVFELFKMENSLEEGTGPDLGKFFEEIKKKKLQSAGGKFLPEVDKEKSFPFFRTWMNVDKDGFVGYLKEHLNNNPNHVIWFLKMFLDMSIQHKAHYLNFTDDKLTIVGLVLDPKIVMEYIKESDYFVEKLPDKIEYVEISGSNSDENIVIQFMYHFNLKEKQKRNLARRRQGHNHRRRR